MKPGDRVVCIKSVFTTMGRPGAVKGRIYTIEEIFTCPCGHWSVDIGLRSLPGVIKISGCRKCRFSFHTPIWYHRYDVFRPLDWDDCRDELIEEILKQKEELIQTPEEVS